jgi:diguanylate cyclase (GGDEF)-like protein/PAS domain S-box-containing protein
LAEIHPLPASRVRRFHVAFMIIGLAAILAVANVVGAILIIAKLRTHAMAEGQSEVKSLAFTLAEESDRSIQALELVEKGLVERLGRLDIGSPEELARRLSGYDAHLMLKDTVSGHPHVEAVFIVSTKGKVINNSRGWPAPSLDLVDREYFKALASDEKLTSYLSTAVRNRNTGNWSMFLARKVLGPNHELLGLLVGGLELKSFEDYFDLAARQDGIDIALVRGDGTVLAQYPHVESAIGQRSEREATQETMHVRSDGDTIAVGSVQPLAHYPLVISVSRAVAAVLADWQAEAAFLTVGTILIVLMIGGIAFVVIRQLESYASGLKAVASQETAEAVMREREEHKLKLYVAVDNMPQGLVMFDADARLVVCNERYLQLYAMSRDFVKPGRSLREILEHRIALEAFHWDMDALVAKILATVAKGELWRNLAELHDGRTIEVVTQPMADGGWLAIHEDITDRRRSGRQLDRMQKFLASVVENVPTTVVVKDAKDLRFLLINRAGEKFFGIPRTQIIGKTAHEIYPTATADMIVAHDRTLLKANGERYFDEHLVDTPGGSRRLVTARRLPICGDNGEPQYLLSLIEDVTERKQAEQRIAHIEHHDPLTDLPNRTALSKHLAGRIGDADAQTKSFAVLSVDLDRFKEVNDVFGEAVGDILLQEIARRLHSAANEAYVARIGSDEFVVISGDGPQPSTAEVLCKRMLATAADKIGIQDHRLGFNLSIGVSIFPDDGTDASTLLSNANAALRRAKTDGRGTSRFFELEVDSRVRDRHALNQDLSSAIERNQFALYFQPQARCDLNVIGFEALLRWNHPTRGTISPLEFIPLAEESGYILAIDEWVLREACREAASWQQPLQVAVNMSPLQFSSGDPAKLVHTILLETGLAAHRLEIEITEGTLLGDFSRVVSILRRLKALGVRVAMDDFGTGYSSLSYLRSFPFDKIKIDKSFVADLAVDPQAEVFLRGIIDLAHGLKLSVLVEGVETEEQLELLGNASSDEVQGYLIGRPRPIGDYAQLTGAAASARRAIALAS